MLAIEVNQFGGPGVLRTATVPDPTPTDDQVLVRVQASGVLSLDAQLRADGGAGLPFEVTLPWIPGQGAAGTVVAIGPGADPTWIDRRVVVDAPGSYAELMVASTDDLVTIPDGVSPADAAALLHDGGTALGLIDVIGPLGDQVLIRPASGGAGGVLVQLAIRAGATVTGVVGSPDKQDHVRRLGAHRVIVDDLESAYPTGDRLFSTVIDGVGGTGAERWQAAVRTGGTYLNYGWVGGGFTTSQGPADITVIDSGVLGRLAADANRRRRQHRILELAAAGDVVAPIGARYRLHDAERAHRDLADRRLIGKAVLIPDR